MLPKNDIELGEAVSQYIKYIDSSFDLEFLTQRVEEYLITQNIKDVVFGLSGGVDSALVLALLCHIRDTKIKDLKIYPIIIRFSSLPLDLSYINDLMVVFDAEYRMIDMSPYEFYISYDLNIQNKDRVLPQSMYALRYHALFTIAQDVNGVTFGTTNADELRYSGWFGKNSDMVVDVQPIWWLTKSLVKKAASSLCVPKSIIDRQPTGDLPNGSTDEENFGCTYDELSWFSALEDKSNLNNFLKKKFSKLISLHEKNKHKYYKESPTHYNPIFL